jgi:hypothetical protein
MIKPLPVKMAPAEVRALFLGALRTNNYSMKTSEIAAFTTLPISMVRRAGLALAKESKIEAVLVPGRGKGEYRFTITQLDLFEDNKPKPGSWMEIVRSPKEHIWEKVKNLFK